MLTKPLADLATALREAGVEASVDPSDLSLPGVWVTLDRLADPTLLGWGSVRARLVLLVPDRDHLRALEALDALLEAVLAVVDPMSDVEAGTFTASGTDVPGLSFTTDLDPES